jgi:hypothetical protein
MRLTLFLFALLVLVSLPAFADLNQGDTLPNATLGAEDDTEVQLYDLLNQVSVIHLWKCQ